MSAALNAYGNQGASDRQVGQLLDALMYRIKPEGRAVLMRELPEAYNAYCGRAVVEVVRVSDGSPVDPPAQVRHPEPV